MRFGKGKHKENYFIIIVLSETINITELCRPRSIVGNNLSGNLDYPDYPAKYDEYPIVVPKRAALLFDQLMIALQKVVDQGRAEKALTRSASPNQVANSPSGNGQTMDLQRRGQAKGRVYWRCYFNAVTCFKKK
uniref:Allatostatin CC n=1 Tax=Vespula pensylvanica TaxID=30213 RepID=A0A834U9M6_VESPE|nr:hypothetical protein H0235_009009 [Vespula pensylvanica]